MATPSLGSDPEPVKKKARVEPTPQATSANEAIRFHFVASVDEIPDEQSCLSRDAGSEPLFTNQVFEDEQIQGYAGLQIDIVFDTAQYIPRILHKHDFKSKTADDYVSLIKAHFTEGLCDTLDQCAAMQAKVYPLSKALDNCNEVHNFTVSADESLYDVKVLHCIPAQASTELRCLHARLHPLVIFNIDAASELQQDDENMHLLLMVKYLNGKAVAVLGLLTFFEFYAFPTQKRYRVAQVLVMPPFQRKGLGRELLHAVTKMALESPDVIDVAYEDPVESLQALRERMDAERAIAEPDVWCQAQKCVKQACEILPEQPSTDANAAGDTSGPEDMQDSKLGPRETEALVSMQPGTSVFHILHKKLKIIPKQVQLVWDVVLWAAALRCRICSQDTITDLLQARMLHRELVDAAEHIAKGPSNDSDVPANKVVMEGVLLDMLEQAAAEEEEVVDDDGNEPSSEAGNSGVQTEQGGDEEDMDNDEGEDGCEGEEDCSPSIGRLEYVMFRVDRQSKVIRHARGFKTPTVSWEALNDTAKESIIEIVNERREAIEQIAHGMHWPATQELTQK